MAVMPPDPIYKPPWSRSNPGLFSYTTSDGRTIALPDTIAGPWSVPTLQVAGTRMRHASKVTHSDDGLTTSYAYTLSGYWRSKDMDQFEEDMSSLEADLKLATRLWQRGTRMLVVAGGLLQPINPEPSMSYGDLAIIFRLADARGWLRPEEVTS